MDVEDIVENARGTIRETALRGDQSGYVPPGVVEWAPGPPPLDYLADGEQPQFLGVSAGRALKVRTESDVGLREASRTRFDEVKEGITYDGQIGYLDADDPYPNLLFVTDRRLLLLVGKNGGNVAVEFEYDDDDVTAFTTGNVVEADGLRYQLKIRLHPAERTSAYRYLRDETALDVTELESASESPKSSEDSTESPAVELSNLVTLTPGGFEHYVADVWRARGYSCDLTAESRDGGVDVVAVKESDRVLIQAKRYTRRNVGIDAVQRMAGLLVDDGFDASKVVLVTTSGFTHDAKKRARRIRGLDLVDGRELVSMGNEVGVGVTGGDGDRMYETEVTAERVLAAVEPGEPRTTAEIATTIGTTPGSALARLRALAEGGKIRRKRVGANLVVWYR